MNKSNIPNLFLIGAPKAGTSALASQLGQHPDIYMGAKEPRYFDARTFFDNKEDWPINDINEYLRLFDCSQALNAQYRLDASVFNMYSEESLNEILKLNPEAKFILVLRDPLTAAKSMHRQRLKYVDLRMREVSEDFAVCWNMLVQRKQGFGFPVGCRNKLLFRYDLLYAYENYLPFIRAMIDKERIFFIDYNEFKNSPDLIHQRIFRFLNVDPFNVRSSIVNSSDVVKLNLKNRLVHRTRSILGPISKSLGLSGSNISRKMSAILSYDVDNRVVAKSEIDKIVAESFKESYAAMKSALLDNAITR